LLAVSGAASRWYEGVLFAESLAKLVHQTRLPHARLCRKIDNAKSGASLIQSAFKYLHSFRRPAKRAVSDFEIRSGSLEPLQDRQRRPASPQRCILKRNGRAEDRHDPVADKALNDATLFANGFVHQLRQTPHERIGRFLPRAFREAREAHHVSEKDRDLSAFSLHAGLRTLRKSRVAQRPRLDR
jgi:hypothetical protein